MNNSRGFTLVELLVALALSVGAVLTLATMSTSAYERVERSGQLTKALALSQQRIEWLRDQPFSAAEMAAGATVETLTGDWSGFVRRTEIVNDTPSPGIKHVTVSTRTPGQRRVQLTSLIGER